MIDHSGKDGGDGYDGKNGKDGEDGDDGKDGEPGEGGDGGKILFFYYSDDILPYFDYSVQGGSPGKGGEAGDKIPGISDPSKKGRDGNRGRQGSWLNLCQALFPFFNTSGTLTGNIPVRSCLSPVVLLSDSWKRRSSAGKALFWGGEQHNFF